MTSTGNRGRGASRKQSSCSLHDGRHDFHRAFRRIVRRWLRSAQGISMEEQVTLHNLRSLQDLGYFGSFRRVVLEASCLYNEQSRSGLRIPVPAPNHKQT